MCWCSAAALMQGKIIDGAILSAHLIKDPQAARTRSGYMQEMDLPFQQTGLSTTQKFIARNPDIVRRVVKSVIDATHLMRNNPAVLKRAIGRRLQLRDEKELEDTYQLLKSFTSLKPICLLLEGFKTVLVETAKRLPAGKKCRCRRSV